MNVPFSYLLPLGSRPATLDSRLCGLSAPDHHASGLSPGGFQGQRKLSHPDGRRLAVMAGVALQCTSRIRKLPEAVSAGEEVRTPRLRFPIRPMIPDSFRATWHPSCGTAGGRQEASHVGAMCLAFGNPILDTLKEMGAASVREGKPYGLRGYPDYHRERQFSQRRFPERRVGRAVDGSMTWTSASRLYGDYRALYRRLSRSAIWSSTWAIENPSGSNARRRFGSASARPTPRLATATAMTVKTVMILAGDVTHGLLGSRTLP